MIKSIEKKIKIYRSIILTLIGIICGLGTVTILLEYITKNTSIYLIMIASLSSSVIITRYFMIKENILIKKLKEEKKKMFIRPSLIKEEIGL